MSERSHVLPRWYRRAIAISSAVIFLTAGSKLFLLPPDATFYVYVAITALAVVTYLPAVIIIAFANRPKNPMTDEEIATTERSSRERTSDE
jgi:hypothetical protein